MLSRKNITLAAVAGIAAGLFIEHRKDANLHSGDAFERGRFASQPHQMTWLGWRDVFWRSVSEASEDRLLSFAASVAFYALLAIVPALSVLISIYGLIGDPSGVVSQIQPFTSILPNSARDLIIEQATRLAAQPHASLSLNLIISILLAGWSANAAIKSLFDALNVIYDEREKRSFLWLNLVSLSVTFSAVIVLMLALLAIAAVPVALTFLPYNHQLAWVLTLARWPAFYVVAVLGIAALYWIGPSRRAPKFSWVLPGATMAAAAWAITSAAFSYYVSSLGNYSASYGSLATVVVSMTWLWLSAAVVLLGAQINSELEHQTLQDTTMGEPKPLGARGAVMADRVGAAVAQD